MAKFQKFMIINNKKKLAKIIFLGPDIKTL